MTDPRVTHSQRVLKSVGTDSSPSLVEDDADGNGDSSTLSGRGPRRPAHERRPATLLHFAEALQSKRIMSGTHPNESNNGDAAGVSVFVTVSSSASDAAAANAQQQIEVLDGGTRLLVRSSLEEGSVLLDETYDRVRSFIPN
jgi:hypothetical protein